MSEKRMSIVQGSARRDGNTSTLLEQLFPGKREVTIHLYDQLIYPYDYTHDYPVGDEFMPLMEELIPNTDTLLLATPVYWYSMSGLLKNFLDRFTDLLKINKPLGRQLRGKSLAMVSISNGDDLPEGFEIPFRLTADYLGMRYAGDAHFWLEEGMLPEKLWKRRDSFRKMIG